MRIPRLRNERLEASATDFAVPESVHRLASLVRAMILRLQALILPVRTLVPSGGH